jgi:hypothetical protein
MKKTFLLLSVVLLSCNPDEPQQQPAPPPLDCSCDKVVEVSTFNVVGTPQNPAMNYYSVYTTINVCTQIQRQKTFTTTISSQSPQIGQCR